MRNIRIKDIIKRNRDLFKALAVALTFLATFIFSLFLIPLFKNDVSSDTKEEVGVIIETPSLFAPVEDREEINEEELGIEKPEIVYSIYSDSKKLLLNIVDGNIFLTKWGEDMQQITFDGIDVNAAISPDDSKIIFVRKDPSKRKCSDGVIRDIWLYNVKNEEKARILEGGCDEYMGIYNLEFLPNDNQDVYFSSVYRPTQGAIHRLNILTKEVEFITESLDWGFIKEGDFKGNLFIEQHLYYHCGNGGSYNRYFIVSPEGNKIFTLCFTKPDFSTLHAAEFYHTQKWQRDNFLRYVERKFAENTYLKNDTEKIKSIKENDDEKKDEGIFYSYVYPEIQGDVYTEVNDHIKQFLPGEDSMVARRFEEDVIDKCFIDGALIYNDYNITLLTDSLISIKFDIYLSKAGNTYKEHKIIAINYLVSEDAEKGYYKHSDILLGDIFKNEDYIKLLSDISGKEVDELSKWEEKNVSNFGVFNLSDKALILNFNPEKSDAFSIEIPYEKIRDHLNPDGPLKDLLISGGI